MNDMTEVNQLMDLPNEGAERRPSYNISYECHDSFIFDELSKLADEDLDDDSSVESQEEGTSPNAYNPALDETTPRDEGPPITRRGSKFLVTLGNSLKSVLEGEIEEAPSEDEPHVDSDEPRLAGRPSLVVQFQDRVIRRAENAGNIARSVSFGAFGQRRASFSSRRNLVDSPARAGAAASFDLDAMSQVGEVRGISNETFQQNHLSRNRRRDRAASSAGRAMLDR